MLFVNTPTLSRFTLSMKITENFHDELCRLAAINIEALVLHG
ncbi:MAG TPA: protein YrbN [Leclercia adecarboxylata]|nr:protein YrbN [Leclercia adecarboxylata]